MVTRIVAAWYQLGQDEDYPEVNFSSNTDDATGLCYPGSLEFWITCTVNEFVNVQTAVHAQIARNVSREAITLLKNEDGALPLSVNASLKIFGSDAQTPTEGINGCSQHACDTDGIVAIGWGSGECSLESETNILC